VGNNGAGFDTRFLVLRQNPPLLCHSAKHSCSDGNLNAHDDIGTGKDFSGRQRFRRKFNRQR
jgi:hypothetical protein